MQLQRQGQPWPCLFCGAFDYTKSPGRGKGEVDALLRSLAKALTYHLSTKNCMNDLHMFQGNLWGKILGVAEDSMRSHRREGARPIRSKGFYKIWIGEIYWLGDKLLRIVESDNHPPHFFARQKSLTNASIIWFQF
jgi:hypothetical protein